jgi:hypothetical protein
MKSGDPVVGVEMIVTMIIMQAFPTFMMGLDVIEYEKACLCEPKVSICERHNGPSHRGSVGMQYCRATRRKTVNFMVQVCSLK